MPSVLLVAGLLLGAGTVTVVAQDESPAPDPAAALADSDFAGVFPTELGGLPWDELTVAVGQESFSDSDPEEAARLEALINGLGATIDDVTTVNASRQSEDFSEFTFLVAFRVAGVDADRLLEAFAPVFAESLEEPVQEDGQVAGKDVVTVYDASSEAFFFGEVQPVHMYAGGDMTRTVFSGAQVFDGTGADPYRADIAIDGDRIAAVGPGLDGDAAIGVTGLTLLPGLFDAHVHVNLKSADVWQFAQQPFSYQFYLAAVNLRSTIDLGITSVRDAGGADLGVRRAVEDGLIVGPRMQIALTALSQTGGHVDHWLPSGSQLELVIAHPGRPANIVDGPEAMRRKVRELIRAGADVIKVATTGGVISRDDPRHAQFRPDELEMLVAEATAAGRFVMAHALGAEGIKNALRAGVRSIEHGIYLDDEGIEMMLQRDAWLVPTLTAPQSVQDAVDAGAPLAPAIVDKASAAREAHQAAFRKAIDAGVRVAMGTDAGITPHGQNLRELELMVAGGLTPAGALAAATSSAAELMGMADDLGSLEAGKSADIVVIEGDPYDFDDLAGRIRQVWKAGTQVAGEMVVSS